MPEVCAPGDELKNVFVKLTDGQYIIYVRSAGYDIPVAYTNRKLTTITPISALLGLTIIGIDPKKITDPAEYKKLYDAVKGVLPTIQDEMLFMRGKANYAIRVEGEPVCMRTDKLRFLLEQVQDRYLINLVPPEIFRPGIIEAPTKIPERYKVGIPVEIGVPAEVVKPPAPPTPPAVPTVPAPPVETPEMVRAEIEKALAEIEQQKGIATAAGLTDLVSRMDDLIRWYRMRVSRADELLLRDPERGLAALKDIRDSVVKQVESYRDHLAYRLRLAKLPAPDLERLREMARRAGFWDLATKIGELIERAPPAPVIPAVKIPADVEKSIEKALSLLRRAESLISKMEKERDECIRKGGTVAYTAVSALERLKSQTEFLRSRVKSLQDIIARATGVAPAITPTAPALEETFAQIKAAISKAKTAVPRVQLKKIEVSPIPESVFADFERVLEEAMKAQICILPKIPVPKPAVPELGPVKLRVYKPAYSYDLLAEVEVKTPLGLPVKGADVTVYWSVCGLQETIFGRCARTISELKRWGKSKHGRTGVDGKVSFVLEKALFGKIPWTYWIFNRVYAFAEVKYKGVLTQTPVLTGGGAPIPEGVYFELPGLPAPPAPAAPPAPPAPGLPTTPTPPGLPR
jgi:hypothetical protein